MILYMSKNDETPNLVPVAWAILVRGITISSVIIIYVSFGHLGSTYSSRLLEQQQRRLREQYGLPPAPVITNETILQMPPSLRNVTLQNVSS